MFYILLILLIFSENLFAGSGRLNMPPGFASTATGPTVASLSGFNSAGSRVLTGELILAGKSLSVPVSVSVNKSAASRMAANLLRLTPAARTAAGLAWALGAGIEYCNDIGWCKNSISSSMSYSPWLWEMFYTYGNYGCSSSSPESTVSCIFNQQMKNLPDVYTISNINCTTSDLSSSCSYKYRTDSNPTLYNGSMSLFRIKCPLDQIYDSSLNKCIASSSSKIPAEQSDFDLMENSGVPFNYLQDLSSAGYPIPLELPQISTTLIPIGDQFTDLKTGTSMIPSVNIESANSLANPFGVVYQTYNVPVDSSTGLPVSNPPPGSVTDGSDPNSSAQQSDLCEKHPDIVACADLNPPTEDPELELVEKPFNFSEIAIGGSGACPSPRVIYVFNQSIEFSYQPVCDFFIGMKPFVLAVSWIIAAMIIAGIRGGENG